MKRLPILFWLPKYNFRSNIVGDLAAGMTIGIVHIPQGKILRGMVWSVQILIVFLLRSRVRSTRVSAFGSGTLRFSISCAVVSDIWNIEACFNGYFRNCQYPGVWCAESGGLLFPDLS